MKEFKTPAEAFLTRNGETDKPEEIKAPAKGYRINPIYLEVKSRRLQLMLPPSVVKGIQEIAQREGLSVNETINRALQHYIKIKGETL